MGLRHRLSSLYPGMNAGAIIRRSKGRKRPWMTSPPAPGATLRMRPRGYSSNPARVEQSAVQNVVEPLQGSG